MLNPGGSVKDRIGLPDDRGGGTGRPPRARGHDHRADERQHRPRPGDRRGPQGLPLHLRDGRQAVEPRSRRSFARTARRSSSARRTSRPSRRRATTRWPRGWRGTSPARSSPTSTGTRRIPRAHEATTGPEIWAQTEGRITHFVASVGTGGTITGAARFLRGTQAGPRRRRRGSGGQRPVGRHCAAVPDRGRRRGFLPGHVRSGDRRPLGARVGPRRFAAARRLTREEGILAGESCGTALVADARGRARADGDPDGTDAVVVVLLPDGGRNYLSKLYSDEWMRKSGLLPTTGRLRAHRAAAARTERHGAGLPPDAGPRPNDAARRRGRSRSCRRTGSARCRSPNGGRRRRRGNRRLDLREGPARAGVSATRRWSSGRSGRRWIGRCR